MSNILAIDSGNSYVKWGLFSGNQWIKQGSVFYDEVLTLNNEFLNFPTPTSIIISHVARSETKDHITKLISQWPTKPQWLVSNNFRCNVMNGYSNPNQLGSDRWAALIAAWKIEKHACLVINAGSAVTIDVLSKSGKFLGGIILPGIDLMVKSLLLGTQLTKIDSASYQDFPVSTDSAIQSGMIHSIIGASERMYNLLLSNENLRSVNCIISGGSISLLMPYFKFPIKVVNRLVLEGLIIIALDSETNTELQFSI
ncbi:type III pantothenate kinase [Nitrosomonas supralitoralis]|uniref:Type III pantothenate kinase n=1 Tax=Nitrosomonas supralitoralis TaxID=2116706 RepID=A0A2P7NX37_9PROT|nr:type III pantothenate kinase [Nitrosomonas supralitoralis]PSJ18037.1 type III pantothenate kinase [Nitrosomonas supralitoralis]